MKRVSLMTVSLYDRERERTDEIFLPSLLKRTRGGGARLRRPSRERTRTTWAWIAHEMQ